MTKKEMIEAAKMVEIEMITLQCYLEHSYLARLTEPFASNIKICAEAAHDISKTLKGN